MTFGAHKETLNQTRKMLTSWNTLRNQIHGSERMRATGEKLRWDEQETPEPELEPVTGTGVNRNRCEPDTRFMTVHNEPV